MNPFEAFRSYSATRRELPLDRILARRDQVLQRLSQSYQALIEEESKQLVWVVEQGALSRAYNIAVDTLRGIDFTVEALDFKNTNLLKQFVTDQGRILPRKYTGLPAHYQRRLNRAIKRARQMLLMK